MAPEERRKAIKGSVIVGISYLAFLAVQSAMSALPVRQPAAVGAPVRAEETTPVATSTESSPSPAELDRSIRKSLALAIILNGHGCYRVEEWEGAGLSGRNSVTCVERKGREKRVRYLVNPLKGMVIAL